MRKRIFLVGAYNTQNFGDDLLAVTFVHHIRRAANAEIILLDASQSLATQSNCQTRASDSVTFRTDDRLVIGGGGLIGAESFRHEDLRSLLERAAAAGVRIAAFSIGGSGPMSERIGSAPMPQTWVSIPEVITVRTPADYLAIKSAASDVRYFPDILFQLPPRYKTSYHSLKLGAVVNVRLRHGADFFRSLSALRRIDGERSTLLQTVGSFRYLHEVPSSLALPLGFAGHRYASAERTMHVLAQSGLTVSSKLHVGVCTIATGGAFIPYRPPAKVRALIEAHPELGLSPVREFDEVEVLPPPHNDAVQHLANEASEHIEILHRWLRD